MRAFAASAAGTPSRVLFVVGETSIGALCMSALTIGAEPVLPVITRAAVPLAKLFVMITPS